MLPAEWRKVKASVKATWDFRGISKLFEALGTSELHGLQLRNFQLGSNGAIMPCMLFSPIGKYVYMIAIALLCA